MKRRIAIFLTLLMFSITMTAAFADVSIDNLDFNISGTAEEPLAVVKASSALSAAQAIQLLFQAQADYGDEDAVMQACMTIPLSVTADGDVITMELADLNATFTDNDKEPEYSSEEHHIMAGGENWTRIQLLDNHDGTYSLLTYQEPDDGMYLYSYVRLIFSESTANMLCSSEKEALWEKYYAEADRNWEAFCSRDVSDEGTPVILEMNVTTDDVNLNLTYLRDPDKYPASNIREYTMEDGTSYIWIIM